MNRAGSSTIYLLRSPGCCLPFCCETMQSVSYLWKEKTLDSFLQKMWQSFCCQYTSRRHLRTSYSSRDVAKHLLTSRYWMSSTPRTLALSTNIIPRSWHSHLCGFLLTTLGARQGGCGIWGAPLLELEIFICFKDPMNFRFESHKISIIDHLSLS
jgi:hypothetical protein